MQSWLKYILTICITLIFVWFTLPITESIIYKLSGFSYALFDMAPQILFCVDIIITILSILCITWFASFKRHRIDKSFLNKLLIVDLAIVSWWYYENFFNGSIKFYTIYRSCLSYFEVIIGLMAIISIMALFKYNRKSKEAESSSNAKPFIHDAPKKHINEDNLKRESLVNNLVAEILTLDTTTCSRSLAITSAWGNGKTTFLNFIIEQLQGKIEIMLITPWNINPVKSITTYFFEEIIKNFSTLDYSIAKSMKNYAYLLEAIDLGWMSKSINVQNLTSLTELISKKLVEHNIKILIIFDDIDRLSASEIEEIFRIIRGSANFSNFIFLSAFDKRYVQSALKNSNPAYNEHYIEKFFESEFALPEIRVDRIHDIILDNIGWMDAEDKTSFESYIAINKFLTGELPAFYPLTNLRSIYRWLNGIHERYEILKGECKIEDLADLEMLYLLFPDVYTLLAKDYKRFLYSDRCTTNYQLWNRSKKVSRDDDYLQYLNQRNMIDLIDYCKNRLKYNDYQIDDLTIIMERLVPNIGRVNDLSKSFSNPNYTQRYFNGVLQSSEISDVEFDRLISNGRSDIKQFLDKDVDKQYSHSLFLQCLNKSRLNERNDDVIIENIIFLVIYGTIHYGQIMLSNYDLMNLINKLSYDLTSKKKFVKELILNEQFSSILLFQFSPTHADGTTDFSSLLSKEDSDSIMAEMLTKAIDENYSINDISNWYFYTQTKVYEENKDGKKIKTYKSLNQKAANIFKKYLAQNFLKHTPSFIWHNHPHEEQVFPSEYFTGFWQTWDSFFQFCKEENLLLSLSETEQKILLEYQSFMNQWIASGKAPIAFEFSIIKL